VAGNRRHLWGEQHRIEPRTKRNHWWANLGCLTSDDHFSRSPLSYGSRYQPANHPMADGRAQSERRSRRRRPVSGSSVRRRVYHPFVLEAMRLHSAGGLFACRHCLGLAYASQQEPVRERGIETARKIQMRLGGGESITEAFPEKPKGMHLRRYIRLRHRHDQAYERSLTGLAKSTERLERWLFK
jgi:hypothetical protein